jgi:hypothetical protein
MEKKITIYTVKNEDGSLSKAYATKKLAQDAENTLKHFGLSVKMEKESKTVQID